jgi:tetratricopeptide (TPR) repeat protein
LEWTATRSGVMFLNIYFKPRYINYKKMILLDNNFSFADMFCLLFLSAQKEVGLLPPVLKELHHSPLLVKLAASLHVLLQQQQQQQQPPPVDVTSGVSVDMLRAQNVPSSENELQDSCVRLMLCIAAQQKLLFEPELFQNVLDLSALLSITPLGLPLSLLLSKPDKGDSGSIELSCLLGSAEALTIASRALVMSGLAHWSSDGLQLQMPPLFQSAWRRIFDNRHYRSEALIFGSVFWQVLEKKLSHSANFHPFQWVRSKSEVLVGLHLCESKPLIQALRTPESCSSAVRFVCVVAHCVRGFRSFYRQIQRVLETAIKVITAIGVDEDLPFSDKNRLCMCLADILSDEQEELSVLKRAAILYTTCLKKSGLSTKSFEDSLVSPFDISAAALSMGAFANLLQDAGSSDEAVEWYQRSLDLLHKVSSTDPAVVPFMAKIASLLEKKGPQSYARAEEFYEKAHVLCNKFKQVDYCSSYVVSLLCGLAGLLMRKDRSKAELTCREALKINLTLFSGHGRNQTLVSSQSNLTATLFQLVESVDRDFGQDTAQLYRRSLELSERLHVSVIGVHRSVLLSLTSLAVLLERRKQPDQAELLYRRAADVSEILHAEALSQESHSDCCMALKNVAKVLTMQARTEESETWHSRARSVPAASPFSTIATDPASKRFSFLVLFFMYALT